jgi:hypothetical protein
MRGCTNSPLYQLRLLFFAVRAALLIAGACGRGPSCAARERHAALLYKAPSDAR